MSFPHIHSDYYYDYQNLYIEEWKKRNTGYCGLSLNKWQVVGRF